MQVCLLSIAGALMLGGFVSVMAADAKPPPSFEVEKGEAELFCPKGRPPEWRHAQVVEGIEIQEERVCLPDDPYTIAAFVKGTNNITVPTLMKTPLAADAVIKKNDRDGDGDPDEIIIKLEIAELNGASSGQGESLEFSIAPGIKPAFWVFSPKLRLLASQDEALELRFPSPVIRVEAGDTVQLVLENTHYLPHTFALFGVDHPFAREKRPAPPGQALVYEFTPRQPGTMFYQADGSAEVSLGLIGMFVVEENRPNNWVQTFNIGAGKVRHPARGVLEKYDQEYDIQYQAVDKELHQLVQLAGTPEQVAQSLAGYSGRMDEDYFLLNGRLFPYVLRDSPIIVKPDQAIKLRLFNAQSDAVAIAFQGHRVSITHYDGIEHHPLAQVMRDVLDLAPGQRLDLNLVTSDDGLHSFGPGVWTISGRNLGGRSAWRQLGAIVYESSLGPEDVPDIDLGQFASSTGKTLDSSAIEKQARQAKPTKLVYDLLVGLFLGFLAYVLFANQKRARELIHRCLTKS